MRHYASRERWIESLAERFAATLLPATVSADMICTRPFADIEAIRTGTNLLTIEEARLMLTVIMQPDIDEGVTIGDVPVLWAHDPSKALNTGDGRRAVLEDRVESLDDTAFELALWHEEARLAVSPGAHPHARETIRVMKQRINEKLSAHRFGERAAGSGANEALLKEFRLLLDTMDHWQPLQKKFEIDRDTWNRWQKLYRAVNLILTALPDDRLAVAVEKSNPNFVGEWIKAEDVKSLTRQIDEAYNGGDAAAQASLCDIAQQIITDASKNGHSIHAIIEEWELLRGKEVETFELGENGVLVIQTGAMLTNEQRARISETAEHVLKEPGRKALVLDGGLTAFVVNRDPIKAT